MIVNAQEKLELNVQVVILDHAGLKDELISIHARTYTIHQIFYYITPSLILRTSTELHVPHGTPTAANPAWVAMAKELDKPRQIGEEGKQGNLQ